MGLTYNCHLWAANQIQKIDNLEDLNTLAESRPPELNGKRRGLHEDELNVLLPPSITINKNLVIGYSPCELIEIKPSYNFEGYIKNKKGILFTMTHAYFWDGSLMFDQKGSYEFSKEIIRAQLFE